LLLLVLLERRHLLPLDRRRLDLHAEDDVADLAGCQRRRVDRVALAVVGEDEVLKRQLDPDPLVVVERRPDMMRLGDGALVRAENDFGLLVVDVQGTEEEDETGEGGVGRARLEPIVVEVRQDHLRLLGAQDEVAKLLKLHRRLEGELELRALDDLGGVNEIFLEERAAHDVREVKQVDLERVKHALAGHDDLLRLLFDRQRPNERGDFFGGLPLGELTETLLTRPDRRVDDLEEELAGTRVEDWARSAST
jgi:hypothetical protein